MNTILQNKGMLVILFLAVCLGCLSFVVGSALAEESGDEIIEVEADGLFVDAAWLSEHRDDVVIVDARSAADYTTQHIPGAVNIHWTSVSNVAVEQGQPGWAEIGEGRELATVMSLSGIDGTKPVVVYTDPLDGWGEDGRILWMLRSAGVENVYLLNGGWHQWLYQIREHQAGLSGKSIDPIEQVDTAYVKEHNSAKLIDARAEDEFAGEVTMGEARPGHIPGAVNIPFVSLINEDGTTLSSDALQKLFDGAGLSPSDECIVYCTGGVRGAYVAEMLVAQGFENVKLYTAGFSEWSGDEANPIE